VTLDINTLPAELHGIAGAFSNLRDEVVRDGALDTKTKLMMLLAAAVALRCDPCIRHHVAGAAAEGATRPEILEAAACGVLVSGGPGFNYSLPIVIEALDKIGG
jgi:AhpD family alkylhydroperoxidase